MAYNIRRIDPLDLQPRKAVGLKLPFSNPSVFSSTYTSQDAIKTNLINFFLTAKGERHLNPTFGSEINTFLFDLINEDKIREIQTRVRREIEIFFPRVEPIEINTIGDPDNNTVQFYMRYNVKQTNIEDEVVINFEQ